MIERREHICPLAAEYERNPQHECNGIRAGDGIAARAIPARVALDEIRGGYTIDYNCPGDYCGVALVRSLGI